MNLYTVNCQLTFAAENRYAASNLAWQFMNDIINNEDITNATVETIYEETPDEPEKETPAFWEYSNYPGHSI